MQNYSIDTEDRLELGRQMATAKRKSYQEFLSLITLWYETINEIPFYDNGSHGSHRCILSASQINNLLIVLAVQWCSQNNVLNHSKIIEMLLINKIINHKQLNNLCQNET